MASNYIDNTGEFIEIRSALCEARVSIFGGQIISWKPVGASGSSEEVIYFSALAKTDGSTALRGGVPLCAPWFGAAKLPAGSAVPSHGLLRVAQWKIVSSNNLDPQTGFDLELVLGYRHEADEVFEGFTASVTYKLGSQLEIWLKITRDAGTPSNGETLKNRAVYEAMLHSYLLLENVDNTELAGIEDQDFWDATVVDETTVTGFKWEKAEKSALRVDANLDRIYACRKPVFLNSYCPGSHKLVRSVKIEQLGDARQYVVWHPTEQMVASFTDMPDSDYRKFCCVETGSCKEYGYSLAPGESLQVGQKISVLF